MSHKIYRNLANRLVFQYVDTGLRLQLLDVSRLLKHVMNL